MDARYGIHLTSEAISDFETIARYIRARSPQNAAAFADVLLNAIYSLQSMPHRFKIVANSRRRRTAIHSMVVQPYLVYYRVSDNPARVFILKIVHGARRQPRRFH